MGLDNNKLLNNIGKIAYTLDKAYMPRLTEDYGVLYFDEKYKKENILKYKLLHGIQTVGQLIFIKCVILRWKC